jgi:hypothetical protein
MVEPLVEAIRLLSEGANDLQTFDRRSVVEAVLMHAREIQAQRHPLGFLHLDLAPLVPGESEVPRLHVWSERFNAADGLGQSHDHVWDLCSLVLHGELTDTTFEPVGDPAGAYGVLNVSYGRSIDELVMGDDRFRLEGVRERRVTQGEVYRLEAGIVHETTVAELPTATLVVASSTSSEGPRVFTTVDAPSGDTLRSERQSVGVDEIVGELTALVGAMS